MKKIYSVLLLMAATLIMKSASYTITISGMMYSPASLTVNVGDVIMIQASSIHPLVQVDQTVWNASGTTSLNSGWGVKTADHTFTVSTQGMIYYVCQNHAGSGMKGSIQVNAAAGLNDLNVSNTSVELFPNPATESITIRSESGFNPEVIRLTNIQGSVIAEYNSTQNSSSVFEQKLQLPASIPAGIYFVNMISGDKVLVKKISVN